MTKETLNLIEKISKFDHLSNIGREIDGIENIIKGQLTLHEIHEALDGQYCENLRNTARNDIWFFGHSLTSPFFSIDGKTPQGKWQPITLGRCGTGAGMQCLDQGTDSHFDVFWQDKTVDQIQVAVQCRSSTSEEIDVHKTRAFRCPPCVPVFDETNERLANRCCLREDIENREPRACRPPCAPLVFVNFWRLLALRPSCFCTLYYYIVRHDRGNARQCIKT